jgi:hypothetical protein
MGETQEAADEFASSLADPIGTLYRFNLPTSILKRCLVEKKE